MSLSPDTVAFIRTTTDDHPFALAGTLVTGIGEDLAALRRENLMYRDMLLKIAGECAECNGKGKILEGEKLGKQEFRWSWVPCPDCADIREVLG